MLWLNSSRERIKSENPGISVTEISKKAGEMWRQLGKEEKEVRLADYKEQCKTVYCQSKAPFERTEAEFFLLCQRRFEWPLKYCLECQVIFFPFFCFLFYFRNGKRRQGRLKRSMRKQRRSTKRVAGCLPPLPRSKTGIRYRVLFIPNLN